MPAAKPTDPEFEALLEFHDLEVSYVPVEIRSRMTEAYGAVLLLEESSNGG